MVNKLSDAPPADADAWAAVDDYLAGVLLASAHDRAPEAALAENAAANLPPIDISPLYGKLLALLAQITRARRVLEIGTLGGYSTIWLARALPADGTVVTIEMLDHHAAVARRNIENAGVSERVDLHVGAALDVLPSLQGPFDLIFIDADKPNNPHYLKWALQLSRPGTVIVADNVVRRGGVIDSASGDADIAGVRSFLQLLADEPRLDATAIQTVGAKGWDGFALAVVGPEPTGGPSGSTP
ncbi:O-methyltransferase [Pseudochelatococcus sp. B33]